MKFWEWFEILESSKILVKNDIFWTVKKFWSKRPKFWSKKQLCVFKNILTFFVREVSAREVSMSKVFVGRSFPPRSVRPRSVHERSVCFAKWPLRSDRLRSGHWANVPWPERASLICAMKRRLRSIESKMKPKRISRILLFHTYTVNMKFQGTCQNRKKLSIGTKCLWNITSSCYTDLMFSIYCYFQCYVIPFINH